MNRVLILCFFAIMLPVQAVEQKRVVSGKFDVGDYSLFLECIGDSKPTIVLESGFGGYGSNGLWKKVIDQVSDVAQVCLYDRAGLGKSDKGPVPFSTKDAAIRLHALLEKAQVSGPYVLVSHSYGSYHMTMLNSLFGDSVLAGVFVDPTPLGISTYAAEMWPEPSSADTPEVIEYRTNDIKSHNDPFDNPETLDFKQSDMDLMSAANFGAKPLTIIKAQREIEPWGEWARNLPPEIEQRNTAFLLASDVKYSAMFTNSKILVADTTHHNVHWHEPTIIINEIISLISNTHSDNR